MNRRDFLKNLGSGAATIAPKKVLENGLVEPVKNTIKSARAYDNVVKTIKEDGDKLYKRRGFFRKTKRKLGEIAVKNPKETNNLLKTGAGKIKNTIGYATLNPMTIAEKVNRVKVPRLFQKVTSMFSQKQKFLSDANFSTPLPNVSNWSKRISDIGENPVGKIFLKNAQKVDRYNQAGKLLKSTNGIAESGKTLRKTPFAIASGLGVAYGGYRAKKTYDKYKPEIQTGRKLMRTYNQFKNIFNKENN